MKRRHLAALGLVTSFCVVIALFFLLAIHDNPPVRVMSAVIEPSIAHPGDAVIMWTDYCKYTSAESNLSTYWRREDGLIWSLKQRPVNVGASGCQQSAINLVLPDDIPLGKWQRVNIATYQVNPLASRTASWESNYIEVVER